jgi:LmbE family N-acetylglucosaminyl deacetylase
MLILLIILLLIPFLWLTGFLLVTDFSVPVKDAKQFRRILAIFPHADDEAIMCGGTLHRFSTRGQAVTLVVLTKGEKGTRTAISRENLKEIRTEEARAVAAILGISELIQEDFGDGELHEKKQELSTFIQALIEQEKPDLLLTYDLAGLYGHEDHITCSEIVTELKKTSFHEIPLWYVTLPKRVLARVKPSEYLVTTPHFREKQALPTHKLFIGASVFPKIKAWYAYKSQRAALKDGTTKLLPFWFFLSMVLFEYFADVN